MAANNHKPLAVITGASAGIGAEFARQLDAKGYRLLLTARRKDRLEELASQLSEADWMAADLASESGCQAFAGEVERRQPDLVVNNAGFGTNGLFHETEFDRQLEMHNLHVMATLRVTRAALPGMVRRNSGKVINVASVAGFSRSAGNASYCATKSWMVAFSEGLALEMRAAAPGVSIQALCPGFTYSEFHDVMRMDRKRVADSLWLDARDVVRESLESKELIVVPDWRYRAFVAIFPRLPLWIRMALQAKSPHKR